MKLGELFIVDKMATRTQLPGDILVFLGIVREDYTCINAKKIKCLHIKSGQIVETWSDFVHKHHLT